MLGIAAIGFIAADNAKEIVEKADADLKQTTEAFERFKVDMADVIDSASDNAVRKELESLAETIRYSDPVSSDATKEIETSLSKRISELRDMVQNADSEKIKAKITELRNLVNERNRICKMNKR